MPITGSDQAPLYAQFGVMRFGATRFGYHSAHVFVSVGGVQVANASAGGRTLIDSLSITDILDETPNTSQWTVMNCVPVVDDEVIITLGSINNGTRLFAGHILTVAQLYVGQNPANVQHLVNAVDYTYLLGFKKISKRYTNESASAIFADIVGLSAVNGFTALVEPGLPVVDEITFTNESTPTALTRLMKRIGGYWLCDYHKVCRGFITNTDQNPTDLTAAHPSLANFVSTADGSQRINRVISEGGGGTAVLAVAVGAISLPVDEDSWYSATGGLVTAGPQRIAYTSLGLGYTASDEWVTRTAPAAVSWCDVAWAPALGLFVAVATGGTAAQQVMTSPDGITWTSRTSVNPSNWTDLAWAPSLGLFVAVATFSDGTSANLVMTSPDGTTWTARTAAAANQWAGVAWAPSLSLFAAVSRTGTSRVMTSPDGIAWTSRTAYGTRIWNGIAWAPSLGLFVAVATEAATDTIMTSPDGIAWTGRTSPTSTAWNKVAWAPELGVFVAVGQTNSVMSSANGTAWTSRTPAPATGHNWYDVVWASGLGVFVAVSEQGGTMTSVDGITWVSWAASAQGNWRGLAWAPEIGVLAAVGLTTASVIQLMTNTNPAFAQLEGIPASGAGSILYAIPSGTNVNVVVVVDDVAAQAAVAARLGGDGIIEEDIADGRVSEAEALSRGQALLDQRSATAGRYRYTCRDLRTASGRTITVNLGAPTNVSGAFKIQTVQISNFRPFANQYPTFTVDASDVRYSFEDLLRQRRSGG